MNNDSTLRIGLAWLAAFALSACASSPDEPAEPEPEPTAESYFEAANEQLKGRRVLLFFHDVDHAKAIEFFQEVIDNFPYSDYATRAELKIADTHFEQRNFEEARSFYQDFVELHPNHEQVPYAIYRNGLCSFERIRAIDRDQEPTREAIAQFRVLLERYPRSEHSQEARQRLKEAEDLLAERELRIANFYYEQELYHAALERFRRALETYPDHEANRETIARMGFSLAQVNYPDEAERVLRQALRLGVDEELREQVDAQLADLSTLASAGPRTLPRSCRTDPNPACGELSLPSLDR